MQTVETLQYFTIECLNKSFFSPTTELYLWCSEHQPVCLRPPWVKKQKVGTGQEKILLLMLLSSCRVSRSYFCICSFCYYGQSQQEPFISTQQLSCSYQCRHSNMHALVAKFEVLYIGGGIATPLEMDSPFGAPLQRVS